MICVKILEVYIIWDFKISYPENNRGLFSIMLYLIVQLNDCQIPTAHLHNPELKLKPRYWWTTQDR